MQKMINTQSKEITLDVDMEDLLVNQYSKYAYEYCPTVEVNSIRFIKRMQVYYSYSSGPYTYHDTYVGSEKFAGEEAIWVDGKIQYAMNYLGRVLN